MLKCPCVNCITFPACKGRISGIDFDFDEFIETIHKCDLVKKYLKVGSILFTIRLSKIKKIFKVKLYDGRNCVAIRVKR